MGRTGSRRSRYTNTTYSTVLLHRNDDPKKTQGWFGTRHTVTFMLFLGMANAYIMRTNMSVAIVAMVNHTAIGGSSHDTAISVDDECGLETNINSTNTAKHEAEGEYLWPTDVQGYILSSFFYGYVLTQIPFGILAKRYGNIYFLGIGMLINSLFGLLVPISAKMGIWWLIGVRFIQGLGEGPIVPCTHSLLAKWIPPNERSRMGAFVYAGAQFGTVISMPLSGLLSECRFGWPSIFYVFGTVGTIWCIFFLLMVHEDPQSNPKMKVEERLYIQKELGSKVGLPIPPIPWMSILTSMPFYAILLAHMGHNYGYETLMTELPTYMKQIHHFSIKDNGVLSALPYLAMWIFSIFISHVADFMLTKPYFSHTLVRKIINGIGQYGPAIALVAVSFTGCDKWLTVAILTIGVGLNGGIYSGFKVNHLDISPQFAGILMSFTNCMANLAGLLAPIYAGHVVVGTPSIAKWRTVFITAASVYAGCCTFYVFFASGQRQSWDQPPEETQRKRPNDEPEVVTTRA
ncbi:putative inorganic phosphate cotransporter isoform X1 [Diabrotica virgifera virgifera]|uniref:Major facilitator superfamily (MFS) profile domain-containing protein n=2 Tax=Diabrotica virgifera virgifera TaxID=50390 RepID=A0ABM5IMB1_DIAVI|nr:putative inorganic phosphate cotransporter isoform X1 [Diabrotica virgifera virgifera]